MDGSFQETEHMLLQRFLGDVLDAFGSGQIDRNRAMSLLGHVTMSAASDRSGEFLRFIGLEPDDYVEPLCDTRKPRRASDKVSEAKSEALTKYQRA